jgi:lysozyme family protein
MNFSEAVEIILEHEGDYTNNPKDPGGETRYGISKRAYPTVDIRALTKMQAVAIYKADFWDKLRIGEMPADIRLSFFDCAVNQGPHAAATWLQQCALVDVDGVIGPKTLEALAECDVGRLRAKFFIRRMRGYIEAKGWPTFGKGWAMRLLKVALA